jgi:hypothetical protein
MNNPIGIAEISFPPNQGWNLPTAGRGNPLEFWSHIHSEKDLDWGKKLWTVFIEPPVAPIPTQFKYTVKISFFVDSAPHHFIEAGNRFALCIGNLAEVPPRASGVIIRRSESFS